MEMCCWGFLNVLETFTLRSEAERLCSTFGLRALESAQGFWGFKVGCGGPPKPCHATTIVAHPLMHDFGPGHLIKTRAPSVVEGEEGERQTPPVRLHPTHHHGSLATWAENNSF